MIEMFLPLIVASVATPVPAPGFIDSTRADIRGTTAQAIRLAYGRWSRGHPGAPHIALAHIVVQAVPSDEGSILVRFFHVSSEVTNAPSEPADHDDFTIAAASVAAMPVPLNGKVVAEPPPLTTLPGKHVAALLLAADAWDAYGSTHSFEPNRALLEKNIVIREALVGERLEYGVGFSPRVYISGTIGCDFQWRINAATWKIGGTSLIC